MAKETDPQKDAAVPTYTYLGLSEKDSKAWIEENTKQGAIAFPDKKEFKIYQTDQGAVLQSKKARRAKYLKDRKAEIAETLEMHNQFRTVCGATFVKGKPVALDELSTSMLDEKGKEIEVKVELTPKTLFKLDSLVLNGLFERKPPLSEERKAELNGYKSVPSDAARLR